jgi:hypothetical protein
MTCKYRNNDSSTLLSCQGLAPLFTDAQVSTYADRVGADRPYVYNFVLSCLRVNRLIRPNIPEGPCGGALHAVVSAPQQVFAGISRVAMSDPEPISRAIITGVGKVGSLFSAIFSGAPSAREIQADCEVVNNWNAWADSVESGITSGSFAEQDALVQLKQIQQQAQEALNSVMGGHDSAPYFTSKAVDALALFYEEVIYPSLTPKGSSAVNDLLSIFGLGPTNPSPRSAAGASSAAPGVSGKTLLWVGVGILIAKLLGVF